MGLRSKPRVTVLADPDEDDFDGVELVTFDTPRPTAFADEPLIDSDPPVASSAALDDQLDAITAAIAIGDESAAAELVAASERGSSSALVVEPTVPSAVDDEPYDENPEANTDGPLLVTSRRTGRRGLVLALLGLLAAAVLGGAYLSHDSTPGPALAAKPPARPSLGSSNRKPRPPARPRSRMNRAQRPRRHHRHHGKPQRAPRAVTVAPAPAPALAPLAPVRPPVSAPAPPPPSPSGGEFLIGGP